MAAERIDFEDVSLVSTLLICMTDASGFLYFDGNDGVFFCVVVGGV